jgi:hypothetical protein
LKISVIFKSEIEEKVFLKSNIMSASPVNFSMLLRDVNVNDKATIGPVCKSADNIVRQPSLWLVFPAVSENAGKFRMIEKGLKDE